jgi:hypothetical protein
MAKLAFAVKALSEKCETVFGSKSASKQELKRSKCLTSNANRLSYDFFRSCATIEPPHATSFVACSGGGWIVNGLVVMDRSKV